VVIDESGSARGVGLQSALLKRTLDWVATALQRDGGDAFLVGFNDQIVISTELVTDVAQLRNAAEQLRPLGGSAIRDALVHTAQKFNSIKPEPNQRIRVILFLSDGFDNASCANERRAIEAAKREHIRVYAVSFPSPQSAEGKHLLDNIAKHTGGKAFFPASDPEVSSALAEIDRDLANGVR
jgi:Mg-chelatase subunit ChlD